MAQPLRRWVFLVTWGQQSCVHRIAGSPSARPCSGLPPHLLHPRSRKPHPCPRFPCCLIRVHRGRSPGRHAASRYADAGAGSPRTGAGRNVDPPPVPPQPESVPPADPATAAPLEQVTTEPVEAPAATPLETPAEAPEPLPDPPAAPVAAACCPGAGGAGRSAGRAGGTAGAARQCEHLGALRQPRETTAQSRRSMRRCRSLSQSPRRLRCDIRRRIRSITTPWRLSAAAAAPAALRTQSDG